MPLAFLTVTLVGPTASSLSVNLQKLTPQRFDKFVHPLARLRIAGQTTPLSLSPRADPLDIDATLSLKIG